MLIKLYLCYLMKCWKRIGIANVFYDLCKALMMHAIENKIAQHWKVREVVSAAWSFKVVLRCLSTGARWHHATDCGTDINGTIVISRLESTQAAEVQRTQVSCPSVLDRQVCELLEMTLLQFKQFKQSTMIVSVPTNTRSIFLNNYRLIALNVLTGRPQALQAGNITSSTVTLTAAWSALFSSPVSHTTTWPHTTLTPSWSLLTTTAMGMVTDSNETLCKREVNALRYCCTALKLKDYWLNLLSTSLRQSCHPRY